MNDVQQSVADLESRGWTLRAIADEVHTHWTTVARWKAGSQYPEHAALVISALYALLKRKRVPKQRRYAKGSR